MRKNINIIEGEFNKVPTGVIAIITSRFNEFLINGLIDGAVDALTRHGVASGNIEIIKVAGAYELPLVTQTVLQQARFCGAVTLGAVVRGDTSHFEYVASAASNGILQASLSTGKPATLGVLTTENIEQTIARVGSTHGNKGYEAAMALLESLDVIEKVGK